MHREGGGTPSSKAQTLNLALLVPSKTSEVCCGHLRTPSTKHHRIDLVTRSGTQERPPPTGLRHLTI